MAQLLILTKRANPSTLKVLNSDYIDSSEINVLKYVHKLPYKRIISDYRQLNLYNSFGLTPTVSDIMVSLLNF